MTPGRGVRSMTGFGRGEAEAPGGRLVVEIRAVNHRFCELALRLPAGYAPFEPRLRRLVADRVARGRIDVTVALKPPAGSARLPAVDWPLAEGFRARLAELKARLALPGEVDLALLAAQRGVLGGEEPAPEPAWEPLAEATEQALAGLLAMREEEGRALAADLAARLARMEELTGAIARRAPRVPEEYRQRLAARLRALAGGAALPLDPGRLEQEVALLAERSDVTEELTRLASHLGQLRGLLAAAEPVGRRLEFLLQEVGREVNTIGAKSADLEITQAVVELKVELEKVREQVANIE